MPAMIDLQNHDGVFVLRMSDGENRINAKFLDGFSAALDTVDKAGAHALVTTGDGKFYSNGLDLDWMMTVDSDTTRDHVTRLHQLYKRIVAMPLITVCAINGHAFAGGGMLALAHDFRVMRNDRGYFCLPEVDIQIPFTPMMSALCVAKLPTLTSHEAMTTGRRYTAEEAKAAGIVHTICPEAEVLPEAAALAKKYGGKTPATLGTIKRDMYRQVLDAKV